MRGVFLTIALMAACDGEAGADSVDAAGPVGGAGGHGGEALPSTDGPESSGGADASVVALDANHVALDATQDSGSPLDLSNPREAGLDGALDPATLELNGPCPLATRFGGFKVEANEAQGYTAIDGVVRNGVPPNLAPDVAGVHGDCTLLRSRRLVCDPPCQAGMTCDVGGLCIPTPLGQDMGNVAFRGLVEPVDILPLQPGNTYFFTRLPHPGFEPGRVIELTNTPGFLGPLALFGAGVQPIVVLGSGDAGFLIQEGQPLHLLWEAPTGAAARVPSRVLVEMNIDQHGLSPANLVCDLPDTGEAILLAAATDALIAAGVTGFPSGRMTRRTADSFTDAGRCVDFFVTSVRPMSISVAGFVPCVRDADCPPPSTCNLLIQQCQ